MLTSGDIQFEPPLTSKITALTTSIAVLQAGDAAFHSEIMWGVTHEVSERIAADPVNWWLASDVADLYVRHRNLAKAKRAEAALLAPLGLTVQTFLADQNQLNDQIVDQISRDLINFDVPYVAVLIVGIDTKGPHIYVVDDGNVSCNDVIGFAAIGIGARHAESQFMLAGHSWQSPQAETALLTYVAKKRAEVAPGVGGGTEMLTAGPGLGTLEIIGSDVVDRLDRIYRRMKAREDRSQRTAEAEMNSYVDELQRQREAAQRAVPQQISDGRGSADVGEATAPKGTKGRAS
jgi:hypothetical protein